MQTQARVSQWWDEFKVESQERTEYFSVYDQSQYLLESRSNENSADKKRGDFLLENGANTNCEHGIVAKRLYRQYSAESPMYDHQIFGGHYLVWRTVFTHFFTEAIGTCRHFRWKENACGMIGILPILNITVFLGFLHLVLHMMQSMNR